MKKEFAIGRAVACFVGALTVVISLAGSMSAQPVTQAQQEAEKKRQCRQGIQNSIERERQETPVGKSFWLNPSGNFSESPIYGLSDYEFKLYSRKDVGSLLDADRYTLVFKKPTEFEIRGFDRYDTEYSGTDLFYRVSIAGTTAYLKMGEADPSGCTYGISGSFEWYGWFKYASADNPGRRILTASPEQVRANQKTREKQDRERAAAERKAEAAQEAEKARVAEEARLREEEEARQSSEREAIWNLIVSHGVGTLLFAIMVLGHQVSRRKRKPRQ